jgi:D-alanyl-D-alanine carboxypeptidase/D-alanyl-D-alanine-endopeptidase (penicillin-binding protein 4)
MPGALVAAAAAAALGLAVAVPSQASGATAAVPPVPPVPATVLPATTGSVTGPAPDTAALVRAVTAGLTSRALGTDVTLSVIDVATGASLVARADTRPQKPASTLKLLTGLTVLRALGDDARLTTKVVAGAAPRDLVLVGGGDATLTRLPVRSQDLPAGQAARPASLAALVASTVAALKAASRGSVTVQVDDSLFTGPRQASGWPSSYVSSGVVAPVSALSVDQGARSASSRSRDADPALAAGAAFVSGLKKAGITVLGPVTRVVADPRAAVLASVQSPTVSALVERMLTASDDALAEALAHLAGGKLAGDASFVGGTTATVATLTTLGVPTTGVELSDGSGLSLDDRLPATTLVHALAAVATDAPVAGQTVGALWPVMTGLPVAGVTGTLAPRFASAGTTAGRGVVRAKTGTLTGVDSLAGLVRDVHGRLLAFAFVADSSPGPVLDARAALDRGATALVTS